MALLNNFDKISIIDIMGDLNKYTIHPDQTQRVCLEYLERITNGAVDILNPTAPFPLLLEMGAVLAANAIIEDNVLNRKHYVALTQNESDLYHHLYDKEFDNRFAIAASTKFTVMIQKDTLLSRLVNNPTTNTKQVKLPRNTEFTVDGITYSVHYPILIELHNNNVLTANFVMDGDHLLGNPPNINLPIYSKTDATLTEWLSFELDVNQFGIKSTHFTASASTVFDEDIDIEDQYYYAKVYYRDVNSTTWIDLKVTHSDLVYDHNEPTCLLTVYDKYVNVYIPPIYTHSGVVYGQVRVDIYTTKGSLFIDYSNYQLEQFGYNLVAYDEDKDYDVYTNALIGATILPYTNKLVHGGKNKPSFEEIRQVVVGNSTGVNDLPISDKDIVSRLNDLNYQLVYDVDSVTKRIYLANRQLPTPTYTKLTTPANLTIGKVLFNPYTKPYTRFTKRVDNYVIIKHQQLFKQENGVIELVVDEEFDRIRQLNNVNIVDEFKNNNYLVSPFHYVMDIKDPLRLRGYLLKQPTVENVNFKNINPTLMLNVYTGNYQLTPTIDGFKLTVRTVSDDIYKQIPKEQKKVKVVLPVAGSNNLLSIDGKYVTEDEGESIYEIDLLTNFVVSKDHQLYITNGTSLDGGNTPQPVNLSLDIELIYLTSSINQGYKSSSIDNYLNSYTDKRYAGISQETFKIKLGSSLDYLWTNILAVDYQGDYQRYSNNIPLVHDEDKYDVDPVTGSIFKFNDVCGVDYNRVHLKGEPVLDSNNEVIFKHKEGDLILADGLPKRYVSDISVSYIDLLLIDAEYYFTSDVLIKDYLVQVDKVLDLWLTNDLPLMNKNTLEKTKIFFYPKRTMGLAMVDVGNDKQLLLNTRQDITIDLYISSSISNDTKHRGQLERTTTVILNDYLNTNDVIVSTEITKLLMDNYGDSVKGVKLHNCCGDYPYARLLSQLDRFTIGKNIKIDKDNQLSITEAITFNYITL